MYMKRTYHGDSVPTGDRRLYRLYRKIKDRCYNKKQRHYDIYGGSGVRMCKSWYSNYKTFRDWAYRNGYGPKLSIDRINRGRGYSPTNCRWVTQSEQMRNTSRNVIYNGECALDASLRLGASPHTVSNRIALGWSKSKAFTTPLQNRGGKLNLPIDFIVTSIEKGRKQLELAKDFNVTQSCISRIYKKYGKK